jgi:diguanylate cyclase (GGDEF)-like protein
LSIYALNTIKLTFPLRLSKPLSKSSVSVKFFCALLYLVFFMPLNLSASQVDSDFNQLITKVEKIKDDDVSFALNLLTSYNDKIDLLKLEQQILYYKVLAEIYLDQDQYLQSKEIANKGLRLTKRLNSPSIIIAELLYFKGFSLENLGNIAQAERDYESGLAVAKSLNNKVVIAEGLLNLGAVYYLSRRFERSLIVLNDAYTLANQSNDEELKGSINSELGILYAYLGQNDKSLVYYKQSYQHFINAGKSLYAYNSLSNIAINHNENGKFEQAIDVYQEIINHADKIMSDYLLYNVYSGMSWAQLKKEESNPEAAYQYITMAEQFVVNVQQHQVPFLHLVNKALILKELQRYDEALVLLFEAEDLNQEKFVNPKNWFDVTAIGLRAKIYYALGRYKEAYKIASRLTPILIKFTERENVSSVEDLRLKYESEQANLLNKILEQSKSFNALALDKANKQVNQQRIILSISAIVALLFVWLFIKVVYAQKKLLVSSRTDGLTQINNRHRIMQLGESIFNHAKNNQRSLSLLMIDIDHFKQVNDNFGHRIGDDVLKAVAQIIDTSLNEMQSVGRYGGEEFIVYLPNEDVESSKACAENIRAAIFNYDWSLFGIKSITVSIGLSCLNHEKDVNLDAFIQRTDSMLYLAKAQGRDRVCADV